MIVMYHMLLAQIGWLEREDTNVKDRNAILVKCAPPGGILGYLPRKIAQHLSQLLQRQQIGSEVVVTKLPIKSTSPVDIQLQVTVLSTPSARKCVSCLCRQSPKQARDCKCNLYICLRLWLHDLYWPSVPC